MVAIDPVCRRPVKKEKAGIKYKERVYFFCSDLCRKKFQGNPDSYL